MDDSRIVDLYWARSDSAIPETAAKYGRYCQAIAWNILYSIEDAEEAVNDTYLGAWNSMPPHRPHVLSAFLAKITRRAALNKWRDRNRGKRGGGEVTLALDELEDCIPSSYDVEREVQAAELAEVINAFVTALPATERRVFVCRYWYLDPVSAICLQFGFSQEKVKTMLFRTRKKLLNCLTSEGYINEK